MSTTAASALIRPLADVSGPVRALRDVLSRRPSALFCDIDGTLSPIVDLPHRARVLAACRLGLRRLVPHVDLLCLLTGRPADDAWRMVRVDEAIYVGDHGAETWVRGELLRPAGIGRFDGRLARARSTVRGALAAVPGILFEDKGIAFAVHYRASPEAELIVRSVAESAARRHGLEFAVRSAHVEIRAPVARDKGIALLELAERYGLQGLVAIGDDPVDAPAFEAARDHARRTRAAAVTVSVGSWKANATFQVAGPAAVGELLLDVARSLRER